MTVSNRLFEFEDLPWFPDTIRQSMTDCLRFIITTIEIYNPAVPLIVEALQKTNSNQIVDLCSGGGGAIMQIQKQINLLSTKDVKITLTDKFPNTEAFQLITESSDGSILYSENSVDASDVPKSLKGFRTIFTAFHHFSKPYAKAVLQNAVRTKSGIGIFDGGDKNILVILGLILIHPFIFIFCTPFFKPFRISRLVFTYLIPIIPICQIWDGVVSVIRLYKPEELLAMAKEVDDENYFWTAGKMKNRFGIHVSYLIGYHKENYQ